MLGSGIRIFGIYLSRCSHMDTGLFHHPGNADLHDLNGPESSIDHIPPSREAGKQICKKSFHRRKSPKTDLRSLGLFSEACAVPPGEIRDISVL